MPRAIWKGAITFGLVHVPAGQYPASQETEIDFDWLDKRTMDPVGYKRINERTGKEIDKEDIVKGVKQENGDYVMLSEDEIREAYPKTTQTIEIELRMAGQLIKEMTTSWQPEDHADKFSDAVRELVARKVKAGETETVEPIEKAPEGLEGSNIVDLSELLRNSLGRRKGAATSDTAAARKTESARKGQRERTAAKGTSRKRA